MPVYVSRVGRPANRAATRPGTATLLAGPTADIAVLALAAVFALTATALMASALGAVPDSASASITAPTAVFCILVALSLVVARRRLGAPAAVGLVTLNIGINSALVALAQSSGAAALPALGYAGLALYVGGVLEPWLARTLVAVMLTSLAAALLVGGQPLRLMTWLSVAAIVVAVEETVAALVASLRMQAHTDPLTGLLNRTGLYEVGDRTLAMARRTGEDLSAVTLDLDGFKQINDRKGHAAGDRVLIETTQDWHRQLRAGDVLARVGGDEFVLLLPGATLDDAHRTVGRLRAANPQPASAGVVAVEFSDDLEVVLRRADKAMYADKSRRGLSSDAISSDATSPDP